MTTEPRIDPRKNFVPRFLPWLLAAAALAVYWLTLNRWVSLFNLAAVANLSGWTWQAELTNPLQFLVTYPFHWLPAARLPLALNVFSAVCASAALGLLARSVALLPHDRTDAQRRRERSDFSFLTLGSAWLPPVLAVAVCGLQLSFWQHATNFTGEMFGFLLFAFVTWLLLEYRLDGREGRLYLAAATYGAGMVEDWAMLGFLPVFLAAVIWIRGRNFFNLRFLRGMVLCGLAGLLICLLLPTWAVVSGKIPGAYWWLALKSSLAPQYNYVLKSYFLWLIHPQLQVLLIFAYLAPLLVLSIRWQSSFGDSSRMGMALTSFMFHVVHAIILFVCIWLVFDPPFGPRERGFGLTFYYFIALSTGYFCGYFLLVFGKKAFSRSQPPPPPPPLQFLNPFVAVGVFVLAALTVTGLVYKNAPLVRDVNDNTLSRYASLLEQYLPPGGGFLLSDDRQHLLLAQAALVRDGRAKEFVPLDTTSLAVPSYHRYLHERFPQKWPDTVTAAEMTNGIGPVHLIGLLTMLARTNALYYLHPSYGYYFEQFYLEPHGLVYRLKLLPRDTLLPPSLDQDQFAENEAFWSRVEDEVFPAIEREIAPPDPDAPTTLGQGLLVHLHVMREPNFNAVVAGNFYSRDLDFWAVQLQRAGELKRAAAGFELAQKFNPDNIVAQINLKFNRELQAGRTVPADPSRVSTDQFGKYRNWNEAVTADGPFDEPSFCFRDGFLLAKANGYIRAAVQPLTRVRELDPDYLPARLWLAQCYVFSRLPDRALEVLQDPLTQPQKFSLTDSNSLALDVLAAYAYFQKTNLAQGARLFDLEINRHPDNNDLLTQTMQTFIAYGLFTNALAVIDRKLKPAPDDLTGLFGKGYVCIQLHDYDGAVAALTRLLAIQTNNADARFNRALAYLDSGKFDAARADYRQLQQTYTNSFPVAYGLGEIAWREHETNEAVRNYRIYLANANTNTVEATNVILRLRELEGHSP